MGSRGNACIKSRYKTLCEERRRVKEIQEGYIEFPPLYPIE